MKKEVSPTTAAIVIIVVLAVIAVMAWRFFFAEPPAPTIDPSKMPIGGPGLPPPGMMPDGQPRGPAPGGAPAQPSPR